MHKRFVDRLAQVYLFKHESYGFAEAKKWFEEFVPLEDRETIRDAVIALANAGAQEKPVT